MDTFVYYSFKKTVSKKRILKELSNIEKKYKLNNEISKYFIDQWYKYTENKAICYIDIPINKRTNNAIEIFNRYFHKKCNGKGLISFYEMCDSIKTEFKEKEDKLLYLEKRLAKKITKNKNKLNDDIKVNNSDTITEKENKKFIKEILYDLLEEDHDTEEKKI